MRGHRLERDDARERQAEADGDPLRRRDGDADPRERAGSEIARHEGEVRARAAGASEGFVDEREQVLRVAARIVVHDLGEDAIALDDGDAAVGRGGGEREDRHGLSPSSATCVRSARSTASIAGR